MFILCLDVSQVPVIESIDEAEEADKDDPFKNSEGNATAHEGVYQSDEFLVEQMLHGQGSKLNGANRWYDKTMQVSINAFNCLP